MANAESQQSNEKGAKISSTCTGGMVQCPPASEGLIHFDNIQRIELCYRPALNDINRSKMHKHLTPCVRRRISHTLISASAISAVCIQAPSVISMRCIFPLSLMDCQGVQPAAHLCTLPTHSFCRKC